MQFINRFAGTFNQISLWTNYATGDSWDQSGGLPGNVYHMRRYMDASQTTFYDVYVTNVPDNNFNNDGPWVTAVATVPWNFQYTVSSAAIVPMFATGGGPGSTLTLGRSVVIQTIKDPLFNVAMAAAGGIDLKGNNIAADSFDSGDTNYSNGGLYPTGDVSKTKAGGDICTDSTLADSLSVANANIKGSVKTGPGVNTITIGANGTVGDRAWVEGGNLGIQPGHSATDFNVVFQDVTLPTDAVWLPASSALPGFNTINGVTYNYIFKNDGDYTVNNLNGNVYVSTNAHVRLKIMSSLNTSSQVIRIDPNNAYLQIFMVGDTFSLGGSAYIDNMSGHAERFFLFGLPSCTTITFGGNGNFYGGIYAPEATFNLGGGGNNTWDFVGGSVTALVVMNGHFNFHYDENLRRVGPSRGYIPKSWREVASH